MENEGEGKKGKKSQEEWQKEYEVKVKDLTKSLETDKPDKVMLELIDVIPREVQSEQLKVGQAQRDQVR